MRNSKTALLVATLAGIGALASVDMTQAEARINSMPPEREPEEVQRRKTKAEKKRERKNRTRLRLQERKQ